MKTTQLAKLTRPRLHHAVARERLFAKIDEVREHKPALCVVGPPGAGKTTLVASWLDARGIKGIWYQADAGDADLATFFHYLGEAAKPFTRKDQRPLLALTPEYLHDVAGFSRRYFRALFARLPAGASLVLDNYQEVEAHHEFHRLVAEAVSEVPLGITLVAVSRRDPPDCYARLIANERVAFIDWEDLKLTLEEARAIVSARGGADDTQIARLYEQSAGWAAGLTLLAERVRRGEHTGDTSSPGSLEEVFRYFAGELFERMTPAEQRLLVELSYLPRVTEAQSNEVTATLGAGRLLEQLYRRHLFVHRRAGETPSYQFHALLQAFLRHKALEMLSPSERTQTMLRAAGVLERSADTAAAFALYVQAQDSDAAKRLLLREAPVLIAQGRWKVVMERIEALPADALTGNAWLLYWRGMAQSNIEPKTARADLEAGWQAALHTGDRLCQARASAAVIHTYELEYSRFRPMDPWIERLQQLLDEQLPFPDADSELRTLGALLIGMMHRKPDDPRLDAYAERMHALLEQITDANLRVVAATYLLSWGSHTGPVEAALRVRPQLLRYVEDRRVSAVNASHSWSHLSWNYCLLLERERCLQAIAKSIQIADAEGLTNAARIIGANNGTWLEIYTGNLEAAQAGLRMIDSLIKPNSAFGRGCSEGVRAWLSVMQNDPHTALTHARNSVQHFDEAGSIFHQGAYRFAGIWGCILLGDFAGARSQICELREFSNRIRCVWQENLLRASEAHIALECADTAGAHERLSATFGQARQNGCEHALAKGIRPWMPRLCEAALQAGIETDYVCKLIQTHNWPAPQSRPECWPWLVKVRTLGSFQIQIDGEPLAYSHKAPRKPLALLKALIAYGISRVPEGKLIDALWPQEEGDLGYESFKSTLKRLRKLLSSAQALIVAEGTVSLNLDQVWIDAEAFEHFFTSGVLKEQSVQILDLYRGDFLPQEADMPWSVSARERLRRRFLKSVETLGQELEGRQLWDQASRLYERALDTDPIAEVFYQGLMRCQVGMGQVSEAVNTFRRLRRILSVSLGIAPSAESETLHRTLLTA